MFKYNFFEKSLKKSLSSALRFSSYFIFQKQTSLIYYIHFDEAPTLSTNLLPLKFTSNVWTANFRKREVYYLTLILYPLHFPAGKSTNFLLLSHFYYFSFQF